MHKLFLFFLVVFGAVAFAAGAAGLCLGVSETASQPDKLVLNGMMTMFVVLGSAFMTLPFWHHRLP